MKVCLFIGYFGWIYNWYYIFRIVIGNNDYMYVGRRFGEYRGNIRDNEYSNDY